VRAATRLLELLRIAEEDDVPRGARAASTHASACRSSTTVI